jgi:hypothetical protein
MENKGEEGQVQLEVKKKEEAKNEEKNEMEDEEGECLNGKRRRKMDAVHK